VASAELSRATGLSEGAISHVADEYVVVSPVMV
jgi:hypothetical protein